MQRFHIHLNVGGLAGSTSFYAERRTPAATPIGVVAGLYRAAEVQP